MEGFDVSAYELADTATFNLKNAARTDELVGADGVNPITVEIYSPGSPQGVRALHKSSRSAQMRLYRSLCGEVDAKDAEAAERENVEKLASFTKSITNWPVSPADTYANPRLLHFRQQVEEEIGKLGNFSKGSSAG